MKKNPAKKTASKTAAHEVIHIGLDDATRGKSAKLLSALLADQHVLYVKTRNYHWNLTGHRFHSLHLFFEAQYSALELAIDKTAERIRQLGAVAPGSMKEFIALASLKEADGTLIHGDDAIIGLRDDHEASARAARKAVDELDKIGDSGNADFVTNLLQDHEQAAWMLRSFLE